MDSCPKELKPYEVAYKNKIKEIDAMMHAWWGEYGLSAVTVAVEHCIHGRKASSKYIEKPILSIIQENTKENTYKESKEEIAVFEMKQRIKLLEKQGLPQSPS